jgi:UrcA family protein
LLPGNEVSDYLDGRFPNRRPTMIKSLTFALATAAALIASPAVAQPADQVNVTIVHTADIDLSTDAGRRALDQRLATAAHQLCDIASAVDLKALNAERDCRAAVLENGRAKAQVVAARNSAEPLRLAVR